MSLCWSSLDTAEQYCSAGNVICSSTTPAFRWGLLWYRYSQRVQHRDRSRIHALFAALSIVTPSLIALDIFCISVLIKLMKKDQRPRYGLLGLLGGNALFTAIGYIRFIEGMILQTENLELGCHNLVLQTFARLLRPLFQAQHMADVLFLLYLTLDRIQGITHPLQYQRSVNHRRRFLLMALGSQGPAIALALVFVMDSVTVLRPPEDFFCHFYLPKLQVDWRKYGRTPSSEYFLDAFGIRTCRSTGSDEGIRAFFSVQALLGIVLLLVTIRLLRVLYKSSKNRVTSMSSNEKAAKGFETRSTTAVLLSEVMLIMLATIASSLESFCRIAPHWRCNSISELVLAGTLVPQLASTPLSLFLISKSFRQAAAKSFLCR